MRYWITIILIFLSPVVFADWLPLTSEIPASPQVTVTEANLNGTTLRVDVAGVNLDFVSIDQLEYAKISFPQTPHLSEPGAPRLPMISTLIAIPPTANAEISVRAGAYEILPGLDVLPYSDYIEPELHFLDSHIYERDAFYPAELATLGSPEIWRDVRVVALQVCPIQVNPVTKDVRVYTDLQIEIQTTGTSTQNPKSILSIPSPTFEDFYRKAIVNYEALKPHLFSGLREAPDGLSFLIISPDALAGALGPFAAWKNKKGIRTYVAPFSETGDSNNEIKAYIQSVYDDPATRPEYILLIGDGNVLPGWTTTGYLGDNPYGYLEGDDEKLDVIIGRFPCTNSPLSLLTMVNRTLQYEQNPVVDGTDWNKRATLVCSQESSFETKYDEVGTRLLQEAGGYIEINEYRTNGHTGDVVDNVNDGRAFLNYRGYIGEYGITMEMIDPDGKYPFVTWLTCGKCNYNNNDFCVRWMRDGSSTDPEGSIGSIAGSQVTTPEPYARRRDSLDRGIYEAMFEQGIFTMGGALLWGKEVVVIDYPLPDIYTEDTYNHFALMGDPTCEIYTETPTEFVVTHDPIFPIGDSQTIIHVEDSDGNPVWGATVAITNIEQDEFYTGRTNQNGDATIYTHASEMGTYDLVVDGHNFIPYISTIEALSGEAIEGTITNSENGDPVPARVTLVDQYSVQADETGFYRIYVPGAGEYQITAQHFGYEIFESGMLTVAEDETLQVDIPLNPLPSGRIQGYVWDMNQVHLAGVAVMAVQDGVELPPVFTDSEGFYEIICPGSYTYEVYAADPTHEMRMIQATVPENQPVMVNFALAGIQGFEADDGNFTEECANGGCGWEYGSPTPAGGPAEAYEGEYLWGFNLDGNYQPQANSDLVSPAFYVPIDSLLDYHLILHHWYETNPGWDGGHVRISTAANPAGVIVVPEGGYPDNSVVGLAGQPGFTGSSEGWEQIRFDLSAFMGQWIQVKFRFASTNTDDHRGWFIDRFVIYGSDQTVDVEQTDLTLHVPQQVTLYQNYPNPFNPQTTIRYQLPQAMPVNLSIYDISGHLIRTLIDLDQQSTGTYQITWDGTDNNGLGVSSGLYLYTLQTGDTTESRRMLLLK
ncbi:MAG: T9SS C-terminal target domain-containing protein [Gemmatimonadetes bacterium]|nr:MAG: T9SS C-terminal target domain-containing protein [Gemmatimonadota bacterium]